MRDALAACLTSLCLVSLLSCGSSGGGSVVSSNGQNAIVSERLSAATNSENPLIGSWVSGKHNLTFKPDNTYSCEYNRDGMPAVWGSISISGNVAIFSEPSGCNPDIRKEGVQILAGSYTYSINGNTLTFNPVLDLCHDWTNILCLSYQKIAF
jgi:hypothetical protein